MEMNMKDAILILVRMSLHIVMAGYRFRLFDIWVISSAV